MEEKASTRVYRSRLEMYPIVESYEGSTESLGSFCKTRGLSVSTFSYWQAKYRKSVGIISEAAPQHFVPLEVVDREVAHVVMELVLTSGSKLRFYSYPEARYLESILLISKC